MSRWARLAEFGWLLLATLGVLLLSMLPWPPWEMRPSVWRMARRLFYRWGRFLLSP